MLSSWRGQLRGASFRGVRFLVENAGGEFGRRWADHEYPGRDTPYAEDLGRRQRVWRFTGFLIGDTYPGERDRLLAACERAGPGELVHPTIGTVEVACRSVSFTEERERGRYVAFQFEFAEAGQLQEPSEATDRNLACEFASDQLGSVAPASFTGAFDVGGGGAWLADSAAGDIADVGDRLYRLRLPAAGYPQGPLEVALANLSDNAASLALSPLDLSLALDGAFAAFTDAGDAEPVVAAMMLVVEDWHPAGMLGSESRISRNIAKFPADFPAEFLGPRSLPATRRATNTAALQRYSEQLALREIGYAVTGLELDNYDTAIEMLGKIVAAFVVVEADAAAAGDDEIYAALAGLRAAITRMISGRAADLNPLVTYRAAASVNSLALAWRLYQDSARDLEVVTRTRARNPGFLPSSGRVLSA